MEDLTFVQEFDEEIMENSSVIKIEEEVDEFDLEIYDPIKDEVVKKNIDDYRWKYLVLFFYPADFTFVCPTELKDLAKSYDKIKELWNVEILVVSTDSVFSHKGWVEKEPLLAWFSIPMVADRKTVLSRYFGVLNQSSGNAERWTFILDPNGILKSVEIMTEPVWRSANELVRKLTALKFVQENKGMACPASWNNEMPVLKPSIKISWSVGDNFIKL